jgi:hypothetical protein
VLSAHFTVLKFAHFEKEKKKKIWRNINFSAGGPFWAWTFCDAARDPTTTMSTVTVANANSAAPEFESCRSESGDDDTAVHPVEEEHSWRNIVLLAVTWCFTASSLFLMLSTTTAAAKEYADVSAATLPVGAFAVAATASLLPSLLAADKVGKRAVFVAAAALGCLGGVLSIVAVRLQLPRLL